MMFHPGTWRFLGQFLARQYAEAESQLSLRERLDVFLGCFEGCPGDPSTGSDRRYRHTMIWLSRYDTSKGTPWCITINATFRSGRTGLDPSRHLEFRGFGCHCLPRFENHQAWISQILMFYQCWSCFPLKRTILDHFGESLFGWLNPPFLPRLCRLPSLHPSVHDERLKRLAQEAWHDWTAKKWHGSKGWKRRPVLWVSYVFIPSSSSRFFIFLFILFLFLGQDLKRWFWVDRKTAKLSLKTTGAGSTPWLAPEFLGGSDQGAQRLCKAELE